MCCVIQLLQQQHPQLQKHLRLQQNLWRQKHLRLQQNLQLSVQLLWPKNVTVSIFSYFEVHWMYQLFQPYSSFKTVYNVTLLALLKEC